jgi:hypothetical protein
MRKRAVVVGFGMACAAAALLPALLAVSRRDPLTVRAEPAAAISDGIWIAEGEVPPSLRDRAELAIDSEPIGRGSRVALDPGVHRATWQVTYRGGFVRRVGATVVAGPFQDPHHESCPVTVRIGERFLDETVAPYARAELERALDGLGHFTIGRFRGVSDLSLDWVALGGGAGFLWIRATVRFDRASATTSIAAFPSLEGGVLRVRPAVRARVKLEHWALKIGARALELLELYDKDKDATRRVAVEVDRVASLLEGFVLPEVPLPGGPVGLRFCPNRGIAIHATDRHAAIPLALSLPHVHGSDRLVPVRFGSMSPAPDDDRLGAAPLGLDLDLDALNAVLHHMWASGALDELLADAQVAQVFNLHPTVRDLLTLRIASLRFSLPPTIERRGDRAFTISAETALELTDGGRPAPARLFGSLSFDVASQGRRVVASLTPDELAGDLSASVALTCEREPGLLEPCFADVLAAVVDQIRIHRAAVHGWATTRFAELIDDLARGFRLEAPGRTFLIEPTGVVTRLEVRNARVSISLRAVAE